MTLPNLNFDVMVAVLLVTCALAFGVVLIDSTALAVAILLVLAPIHQLPGIQVEQLRLLKQLMTFAIIAVWLLRIPLGEYRGLVRNPMVYAIVPYVALLVITSLVSGFLSESLQAASADLALLALFLCVSDLAVQQRARSMLLVAAIASLSIASILVILQATSTSATFEAVQSFSMLSLPLPLAFAMLTGANVRPRWIWLVPALAMTVAAILADHRGTILAASAMCVGIALYRWGWKFVPVGMAAVAAAALLLGEPLQGYFRTGAGLTGRPFLWTAAIRIFTDHPIFGTGPGSFARVYPAYQPSLLELPVQARPVGVLPHAHNIFLNGLAELGVLGPVCIAFLLGSALWVAFKVWREQPPESPVASLALGLLATIAAVVLQELTESGTVFRNGTQNIFFWVFLGLVVGLWRVGRSPAPVLIPAPIRRGLQADG